MFDFGSRGFEPPLCTSNTDGVLVAASIVRFPPLGAKQDILETAAEIDEIASTTNGKGVRPTEAITTETKKAATMTTKGIEIGAERKIGKWTQRERWAEIDIGIPGTETETGTEGEIGRETSMIGDMTGRENLTLPAILITHSRW